MPAGLQCGFMMQPHRFSAAVGASLCGAINSNCQRFLGFHENSPSIGIVGFNYYNCISCLFVCCGKLYLVCVVFHMYLRLWAFKYLRCVF